MEKKSASVFKMSCLAIFTIFISLLPPPAVAEIKTFVKEYTYRAGDEDSRNSCRTIALREVKRLLLEELGTYLESQTEVKNFQMTKDQITTLTAGIVGAEVIEDTWDGKVYWLKAKFAANPQDVIKSIDSLRKDREKVKELDELRKKSEKLLQENERLNKELMIAKGGKRQEAAKAYKRNIDNLGATEWIEKGYKLDTSSNNTDALKAFRKAMQAPVRSGKRKILPQISEIAKWNEDPEFTGLPYDQKAEILGNYFDRKLSDNEFANLPLKDQVDIKNNFYKVHIGTPPKILPKTTPTATVTSTLTGN